MTTPNTNTFEHQSFSIESSSTLFEILRNKMYSNPIESMCREIMCNARDANREVGRGDSPIEIYLPTYYDSYLRIKDTGPGISPDRMSIYTKYTATTKSADDTQTGGFGLGAKTPFAYCDAFTIITCIDGTKYHYIVHIDESKIGSLFLLNSIKTSDPNGTEVVIPIATASTLEITSSIRKFTQYWSTKPLFYSNDVEVSFDYKVPAQRYGTHIVNLNDVRVLSGNDWDIYNVSGGIVALIDDIPYAIDKYRFNNNLITQQGRLLTFIVDASDVSISSTRETLTYNSFTMRSIQQKLDQVLSKVVAAVTSKLQSCTSGLEALRRLQSYRNDVGFHVEGVTYRGTSLDEIERVLRQCHIKQYHIKDNRIKKSKQHVGVYRYQSVAVLQDDNQVVTGTLAKKILKAHPTVSHLTFIQATRQVSEDQRILLTKHIVQDYAALYVSDKKTTERATVFINNGIGFKRISKKDIPIGTKIVVPLRKIANTYEPTVYYSQAKLREVATFANAHICGINQEASGEKVSDLFGSHYTIEEISDQIDASLSKEQYIQMKVSNRMAMYINKLHIYCHLAAFKRSSGYAESELDQLERAMGNHLNIGSGYAFMSHAAVLFNDCTQAADAEFVKQVAPIEELALQANLRYPLLTHISYTDESADSIVKYIDLIDKENQCYLFKTS